MKENGIEEDIKMLEELRIANENCIKNAKIKDNPFVAIWEKQNRAIEHILSDYKRALKENEEWDIKFCNLQNLYFKLQDESESKRKEYQETYKDVRKELKEWQEAYKSEKKMKNEYVKLYQDLLLKENVIPVQKVKDKIEEEIKYHEKNILDIENITMLKSKTAKEEAEIEFNKYAIVVLNKILQELIEESE